MRNYILGSKAGTHQLQTLGTWTQPYDWFCC